MCISNDKILMMDDGTVIKIDSIRDMTNREISNLLFNIYCDGRKGKDEQDCY